MLATAYINNKKIYVHYEKTIFGEGSEISYDIGKHLELFLAFDIERVRNRYREIAKLFSIHGVSKKTLFACSDEMDKFCPYLHFYTHALRRFCLDFRKNSVNAFCILLIFAKDSDFNNSDKIKEFSRECFTRDSKRTSGSENPETVNKAADELKMDEAIEIAISLLMHDINIKRCRLREEIEFILDEGINSKELNFMQKLYLLDLSSNTYGRSLPYTHSILTSRFTPNSDALSGLTSVQEIKEAMIRENIDVVQMHDLLSTGDLIRLELVGIIENELTIKKCKYCKRYFVPNGRTNIEYCGMIADGETKPCNEIGAIKTYSKSVAAEPANQVYQKAYRRMNSKARTKRMTQLNFLKWSDEARTKRNLCKEGGITIEELKSWLDADKTKKWKHV